MILPWYQVKQQVSFGTRNDLLCAIIPLRLVKSHSFAVFLCPRQTLLRGHHWKFRYYGITTGGGANRLGRCLVCRELYEGYWYRWWWSFLGLWWGAAKEMAWRFLGSIRQNMATRERYRLRTGYRSERGLGAWMRHETIGIMFIITFDYFVGSALYYLLIMTKFVSVTTSTAHWQPCRCVFLLMAASTRWHQITTEV